MQYIERFCEGVDEHIQKFSFCVIVSGKCVVVWWHCTPDSFVLSLDQRVAALGLAAGVLLVLLLFCLYRVLCPRNYGQNGVPHGRRRRGDLPCDDYGYSPPVSEISPLLLRGHSMVRLRWRRRSLCLSTKQAHKKGNTVHI